MDFSYVYQFEEQDCGDIILKKVWIDKTKYKIIEETETGNITLKKKSTIYISDIDGLSGHVFNRSVILECTLDDVKVDKLKYRSIIDKIYSTINCGVKIIKSTKLNIKTIRKTDEGFHYFPDIGISVQNADSNRCVLEIVTQCIENKIKLSMKIKLENDDIVKINM